MFTFSIHGDRNYPFRKQQSDLDIALDDGIGDDEYLSALKNGINATLDRVQADFAIYLAGADPFEGDRLGRLSVSQHGLAARDHFVLETCKQQDIPVAVVMAGGYAPTTEDIVAIHHQTIRIAAQMVN